MAHQKPGRVAYVNARLLDPASGLDAHGGILTDGEMIVDLGPQLAGPGVLGDVGVEVIDCGGKCLAPGLIDIRVQLREPGEEHKETFASAAQAAVAGGVTGMVCLPNTDPVIDDEATLEFVARRARQLGLTKVYPYAAATKGLAGQEVAELGLLSEAGAVAFTDGVSAIANAQVMRRVLSYAATFDLLVVEHPEEPALAAGGLMNAGELSTRLGLAGIPAEAEVILVERDLRLAAMTGARLHFAHVSTEAALKVIRQAKAAGLPVTCDTAPPYFALNEGEVSDYRTFAKLSPPLRRESDRQAVIAALADGTIDVIASDHAPQDQDGKRRPFRHAEFGGIGLETLLPVTLQLVRDGHLTLLQGLDLMTRRPAELLGLPGGRLERKGPADLVLFDPEAPWKVTPESLNSKSKNSPFDGRLVQGRVLMTVIDGRRVYQSAA
ncbi:dihydroorotase [Roseospirillum parvum]|uniref:Dihydroorotase n=1 Tax=Roseospirillum parvum TaxID=83401 RepID=A0A1G7VBU0_9PROT|nr:dihydroorotase [Roseospirillum parvum]SDG57214.1 dihydroorotase [Roseospirillum parvum]